MVWVAWAIVLIGGGLIVTVVGGMVYYLITLQHDTGEM